MLHAGLFQTAETKWSVISFVPCSTPPPAARLESPLKHDLGKEQQHSAALEADIDSRYKRFGHSGKQRHGILSVFISDTKVSASQ